MKYLLHVDGKLPNYAIMRLSSYFKARGEEVRLVRGAQRRTMFDPPGEAFGSSIFSFSDKLRDVLEKSWGPVQWGGVGYDIWRDPNNPKRAHTYLSQIDPSVDWDHVQPDYSLYPDEKRTIGYLTRGCRQRCGFCEVPGLEGDARAVLTVGEFWRREPHPRKLVLLDNDFFGPPEWRDLVAEIRDGKFRTSFSQGINLRLIREESAAALATLEYRDNEFQERVLYTAWDNLGDERVFKRGVAMLTRAGIPAKHLRVYMVVGYAADETWEGIWHRFNELVALGCEPYPMVWDRSRDDLRAFQRWAIRGLYRAVPFDQYNRHIKRDRAVAARARLSLPLLTEDPNA